MAQPVSNTVVPQYFQPNQTRRRIIKVDYEDQTWEQRGFEIPCIADPIRAKIVKRDRKLTEEEAGSLSSAESTVQRYADAIDAHVTRRVGLFFEQAVMCYGTEDLHFEVVAAEDQYGSCTTLKASDTSGAEHSYGYQAAHPSSAPCLYACNKEEWNRYQKAIASGLDAKKPNARVYLKGSSSYGRHNCTDELPTIVNETDTMVDGQRHWNDNLRVKVVENLLNQVAQGLNPIQATLQFIKGLSERVETASESCDPKKGPVLKAYALTVKEISLEVADSNRVFDFLLGVKLDEKMKEAGVIRDQIYRKRYEITRLGQQVESKIAHLINNALPRLRGDENRLKFAMLKRVEGSDQQRKILESLFGKTAAVLEQAYVGTHIKYLVDKQGVQAKTAAQTGRLIGAFQRGINDFVEQNAELIERLSRDIRAEVRELKKEEVKFRSVILVEMIKAFGLTGKAFVVKYNKDHPLYPISEPMLSKMGQHARRPTKNHYKTPISQRCRNVTGKEAARFANTLGVNIGLFESGVFTNIEAKQPAEKKQPEMENYFAKVTPAKLTVKPIEVQHKTQSKKRGNKVRQLNKITTYFGVKPTSKPQPTPREKLHAQLLELNQTQPEIHCSVGVLPNMLIEEAPSPALKPGTMEYYFRSSPTDN